MALVTGACGHAHSVADAGSSPKDSASYADASGAGGGGPVDARADDAEAGAPLSPPPGYNAGLLQFDDSFDGPTLDATKWIPAVADQNGVWRKSLPAPYSGSDAGGFDAEYFDPAQLVVAHGLGILAERSTQFSGYTWKSGCISTHGLYTFKGGYVQIRAKMPDSSSGMWGGLWFLEGGGEIDLIESGYTSGGGNPNHIMAMNLHTSGNSQQFVDTGVDLSAAYHVYGMEYVPGVSVKMIFDGKVLATYTTNVPTGAYTILIDLQVAQGTNGWHTLVSSSTPSPSEMDVSEVQVYALPSASCSFCDGR